MGPTWRLEHTWKPLANFTFTSLNFSPGKWKCGSRLLTAIMTTRYQTAVTSCHIFNVPLNGLKVSIMPLKNGITHIVWVSVSVWMPVHIKPMDVRSLIFTQRSCCQLCHVVGRGVCWPAAGVKFLSCTTGSSSPITSNIRFDKSAIAISSHFSNWSPRALHHPCTV